MTTYTITVAGWLPENDYRYGGTPEYVCLYRIEARSAQAAMIAGRIRFEEQHPEHYRCTDIETTEGDA